MVRVRADLHTHSSSSDGSDSPTELVRKADAIRLGGVALTDHDSVAGIREFMEAETSSELIRVPGLEISTEFDKKEVHILGYFVPLDSKPLNERLEFLRKSRHDRLPKIIRKLNELGLDITMDELLEDLKGVSSPGRPHVAQLLIKKGFVKTTLEAFQKYLASDKPAYVKKARMNTLEAVKLLKSVGVVPVLAHPLTIKVQDLRSFTETLMNAGIMGVEVEYDYSFMGMHRTSDEVREVIQNMEVLHTGGSDYHGTVHYTELGSVTVPIEVIDSLEKLRNAL
ncbi:MAG: PHP domain-containing protein [Candidatus Thorarchaeota archaeon]|nr:PHP domain-containing protein [Candidatus Thorarchaeota archaeon]